MLIQAFRNFLKMNRITFFLLLFLSSLGFSQNIVINNDFNDGLASWTTYVADFEGVSATFSATNNEANITNIAGAGGQVWHVQLNQVLTADQIASLEVGESYKISFSARSNASNRQLRLFFGQDGGAFTDIKIEDFTIGTTTQTYETIFIVGQTFATMKLGFEVGLSNDSVFIDDVVLEQNVIDPLINANLTSLEVDGSNLSGFAADLTNYSVGIGFDSDVPQITGATTSNPEASAVITQATAVPGDATVVVTAEDGETTKTYTISFFYEGPTTPAPTPPTRLPENVLSIFSEAYTQVVIDDFDFGLCANNPATEEVTIAGSPTIKYMGPGCQGIDFQNNRLDASTFTNLHFDFYTDNAVVGAVFNLKLVDWAGNETDAGSTGLEIIFNIGTNPALAENQWVSVDVMITELGGMILGNLTRSDVAQIHITSNLPNVWYDNLYLYKDPGTCDDGIQNQNETGIDCGGPCEPCSGPPTIAAPEPPARAPQNVISFYSDAYTDITFDDFDFGLCGNNPATEEVLIANNPTILYSGPGCQGMDFQNNRIDASTFTHVHFDFYTDADDLVGKVFNIKLVDWAGNETDAGSTGLEVIFNTGTNPALQSNEWVSVDVDITNLGGMVLGNLTRSDVAQLHITSNLDNVWYDNFYLYKDAPLSIEDFVTNEIYVFPNPSSNQWTIQSNDKVTNLQLFDIRGKRVMASQPNANEFSIDASQLNAGIYLAKISIGNSTQTIKLIKK
jgi:hypothetical protein